MRDSFEEVNPSEHTTRSVAQGTNNVKANCQYLEEKEDPGASNICSRSLVRGRNWLGHTTGMLCHCVQLNAIDTVVVFEACAGIIVSSEQASEYSFSSTWVI
jgi:hypothetical protein